MLDRRTGCTPVLRGSTLVGILTTRDLLRALAGQLQAEAVSTGQRPAQPRKTLQGRGALRAKVEIRRR